MLKNYFTIAVRTLIKHRGYTLINVMGLAIGLTGCMLIGLYILNESDYDTSYGHADRIYRIAWHTQNPQTRTPHPMTYEMVRDFPQVENAVSLSPIWGAGLTRMEFGVRYEDRQFAESGFLSADSTFFDVFDFTVLEGDVKRSMTMPGLIVITESIAKKYFGTINPIGKSLRVNDQFDIEVGAVVNDIPPHTHLHFDFLLSYVNMKPQETGGYYTWSDFGHYNYLLLAPNADPETLESQIAVWTEKYIPWTDAQKELLADGTLAFKLQSVQSIHLHSQLKWELEPNGNALHLYILFGVAFFILLIACVNFINLSTARSLERAKEVGMRKTLGATRFQLIGQFLGESFLMCLMALILALVMLDLILPTFNELTETQLSLNGLSSKSIWIGLATILFAVPLLAGSYPSFYLSRFRPIEVLKGKFSMQSKGRGFRKGLVVFQFCISTFLIVGTLIIFDQLTFLQEAKLGFQKEQVLVVPMNSEGTSAHTEALKNALKQHVGVVSAAAVSNVPGGSFNQHPINWHGADDQTDVSEASVDYDYFSTLEMDFQQGRGFERNFTTDTAIAFVINETAAKQFDWTNPIGEEINFVDNDSVYRGTVIGVVKDYHFQSLHQPIQPLLFYYDTDEFNYLLVKVRPENISQTIEFITETWHKFDGNRDFEYSFLDDDFAALYSSDKKIGRLMGTFTGLAILIACLGLFGLIAFTVEQKTKEIGVRKVLGANALNILWLITHEVGKLISIAFVLGLGIGWWAMQSWLTSFAYQTTFKPIIIVISAGILLFITILTLGYHLIQAIRTDPILALRDE